nr:hypothetical protein [Tanacetum cinerariifolium]
MSLTATVNMSLTDINASLTEHNLHQQCKLFSRGNSSTQQWEHFFTSSGKITLAVGTILNYQWQNNYSSGNSAVGIIFTNRGDLIACLNKAMAFLTVVASSRNAAWYKEKAMLVKAQEDGQILDEEQLAFPADPGIPASQVQTIIPHNSAFQNKDLDTYDSDCDDLSNAQAVLMVNISNYGSDVIANVPNSDNYLNDMDNQSVYTLQDFEQSPAMDFKNNEISSDSNIISYS